MRIESKLPGEEPEKRKVEKRVLPWEKGPTEEERGRAVEKWKEYVAEVTKANKQEAERIKKEVEKGWGNPVGVEKITPPKRQEKGPYNVRVNK